jgi:hypothetical protein
VRRLVAEGGRRGISFPINLVTPRARLTIDGRTISAGQPVLISYAAANMDPDRFGRGASGFDPRPRRPAHLAFGEGMHRCQGETGAEQFVEEHGGQWGVDPDSGLYCGLAGRFAIVHVMPVTSRRTWPS